MTVCVCVSASVGGVVGWSILCYTGSLPQSVVMRQFLRVATCLLSLGLVSRNGMGAAVRSESQSVSQRLGSDVWVPRSVIRRSSNEEPSALSLVLFLNEARECLSSTNGQDAKGLVWKDCKTQDFVILRNFTDGATRGRIHDRLGDSCLALYPGNGENAELQMAPCSEDANDFSQLWELLENEDGSTQIRSLQETPEPLCISVRGTAGAGGSRAAEMVSCARGYKVVIEPIDLQNVFRAALTRTSIYFIRQVRYGGILPERNDRSTKMPAGFRLYEMIQACAEECLAMKCKNFEILFDKNICNFSKNSGGSPKDMVPYKYGAVFFDRVF